MRAFVAVFALAAGLLFTSPAVLATQAVTIISNNSDAQSCYSAARIVAKTGFASREDLETCNRALDHGHLKKRDRAGTYVNRGIVSTALARYQDAFRDYHHAIELIPDLPEAYVGRGNIHFLAGKLQEAIDDYSHALELNLDRDYIAFLNRGLAYEKMKRYQEAEMNYQMALQAQPDWTLAQKKLNLVRAKQTIGD